MRVKVGVEEEVRSASVIAKAVECVLKSFMLDNGWRCVGDSIFVDSTFACSEERTHLCAVNVVVNLQLFDFVIAGAFMFLNFTRLQLFLFQCMYTSFFFTKKRNFLKHVIKLWVPIGNE